MQSFKRAVPHQGPFFTSLRNRALAAYFQKKNITFQPTAMTTNGIIVQPTAMTTKWTIVQPTAMTTNCIILTSKFVWTKLHSHI